MARTKNTSHGGGSEPPRRPDGHGKGKGKDTEKPRRKRKQMHMSREQQEILAAKVAADTAERAEQGGTRGSLRIREPSQQQPLRRSTRSRPSPAVPVPPPSTSGRKRARAETQSETETETEEEEAEPESEAPVVSRKFIPVSITATARKVKKIRFQQLGSWFPADRSSEAARDFWTLYQEGFFVAYRNRGILIARHNILDFELLSTAAGGADIAPYFSYMRGLANLVTGPRVYVEHRVRVFYATVWIEENREFIQFMYRGQMQRLHRAEIAAALGVELYDDTRLHNLAYPDMQPPRRARGSTFPPFERVSICYRQPFLPESSRAPDRLTPEAFIIHQALRRTLLPRKGYGEAVTGLQQWLLLHIMSQTPFDIVDLFLCEMEDIIADGLKSGRPQPYAHYICHMLLHSIDMISTTGLDAAANEMTADNAPSFVVYTPTDEHDGRRGSRAVRAARQGLSPEEQAAADAEDEEIQELEARAAALQGDFDSDSESDSDYILPTQPRYDAPRPFRPGSHESEAGGSHAARSGSGTAPDPNQDILQLVLTMQREQAQREERQEAFMRSMVQQQAEMLQALQRDRASNNQMFAMLFQHAGLTPAIQPPLALSQPPAHTIQLPDATGPAPAPAVEMSGPGPTAPIGQAPTVTVVPPTDERQQQEPLQQQPEDTPADQTGQEESRAQIDSGCANVGNSPNNAANISSSLPADSAEEDIGDQYRIEPRVISAAAPSPSSPRSDE